MKHKNLEHIYTKVRQGDAGLLFFVENDQNPIPIPHNELELLKDTLQLCFPEDEYDYNELEILIKKDVTSNNIVFYLDPDSTYNEGPRWTWMNSNQEETKKIYKDFCESVGVIDGVEMYDVVRLYGQLKTPQEQILAFLNKYATNE